MHLVSARLIAARGVAARLRMHRALPGPLSVALTVLLLAGAPAAQLTEKQAASELKTQLKARLKTMKTGITAATKVFELQLGIFEDAVEAGSYDAQLLEDIFVNAHAMQASIVNIVAEEGNAAWNDAATLLLEIEGSVFGGNFLPRDFYLGTGGHFDRFAADIDTLLGKPFAKLEKRIAKTVKLAEKQGVGFTMRLRPPTRLHDAAIAAGALAISNTRPLTVDVAVGGGLLGEVDDSVLWVGGCGDLIINSVTVLLNGSNVGNQVASVTGPAQRWNIQFGDASNGLIEGNIFARAFSNNVGSPASMSIGLR